MLTPKGEYRPLGFYSAHLNETQKKYSTFKKELLGAHKSLRHFLPEVYGKHFTIYTDNLPLQQAFHSNNIPLNDPQVYRQITEIGRFTRDIRHVSGVDNVFADWLSRIKEHQKGTAYLQLDEEPPLGHKAEELPQEVAAAETVQLQISLEALHELQKDDAEIKLIKSGDKPKKTNFAYKEIDKRQIFCEMSSKFPRPYVPKDMRDQIIKTLHWDHLGIKATVRRVAGEYY